MDECGHLKRELEARGSHEKETEDVDRVTKDHRRGCPVCNGWTYPAGLSRDIDPPGLVT